MLIYQITHRLCDWFLKSVRGGLARAKVPCLKNLDALLARIDAKKKKQMSPSRTLMRLYDQLLKEAYRPFWLLGLFELDFKSL